MALEKTILTVTDPTIVLDQLDMMDRESEDTDAGKNQQVKPSKVAGSLIPYAKINGLEISIDQLIGFELSNSGFLPTLRLRIYDTSNLFMGRHFPKDGDVINFYIRANNEDVFKPIRIDFDIVNVDPGYSLDPNQPQSFTIIGQMKVPGLLTEFCEAFKEMSSYDALLETSQLLKLGFASNEDITTDTMTWVNPCDTRLKFIKDTVAASYKNDDSFFTSFVDVFYNLNFVNVNTLFSADNEVEDSELYQLNPGDMGAFDEEGGGAQESKLVLTNHKQLSGSSQFVSKHRMVNNSGEVFLSNGYKRYAQFYEINDNGKNGEFISEFVDPLTTEGTDDKIHLKGRYVGNENNRQPEGIVDTHVKYKYLGKQEAFPLGNVHENFLYGNVQNFQNNEEITKMGMIVDLDMVNGVLYRYQRIPVLIYDYGPIEKNVYKEGDAQAGNDNDESAGTDSAPVINKFLTGHYLIAGIDYLYTAPGQIRQRLHLVRREFDPSP